MSRAKRKSRGLTAEEKALWHHVIKDVAPLDSRVIALDEHPAPARPPVPVEITLVGPDKEPAAPVQRSRERTVTRRRARSEVPPQGRLDLHGMTQDEAHSALSRFIAMSVAVGLRNVLVITGKGRSDVSAPHHPHEGRGILRRIVPLWLESGAMRPLVETFASAPQRLGGDGALMIVLRAR